MLSTKLFTITKPFTSNLIYLTVTNIKSFFSTGTILRRIPLMGLIQTVGNSAKSLVDIRGQYHKAKKFIITKIIFVITNISNFVFSLITVC